MEITETMLLRIFKSTQNSKYISIDLQDGRTIKCTADCFCSVADEDNEDVDIEGLLVVKDDGNTEILIEDDIKSINE